MNFAIIVAAGIGSRFGAAQPKQFLEILGKPLIVHTLEVFERCPVINQIILVLPASHEKDFGVAVEKYNLKKIVETVAGGNNRAESVRNGLYAAKAAPNDIAAVHDGARPLVTVREITATIETAANTGAACLTAPLTDTMKQVRDGKIVRTIDRADLRRALTPQAFRFDILQRAFAENDIAGATDESSLVEKLGVEVSTVEGSAQNIKITTPEDWFAAEMFLRKVKKEQESNG